MMTDFHHKLFILFSMVINFCILIAFVSILPAYFVSLSKENSSNLKLQIQKTEGLPATGEQSLNTIEDVNSKLNLVEKAEQNKFLPSVKIINAIVLNKRSDIKITQILYQNDPTLGKTVSITGLAPSRDILLLFQQALEQNPNFKNVNLPISNFVKGTNIQFSLNLTPA